MSQTYHPVGEVTRLRFLLVSPTGTGITGQTPTILIKRRSDGLYWTGSVFQSSPVALSMVEEDSTNLPGSYYTDFNQTTAGASPAEYLVQYTNSTPGFLALAEEQHVYTIYNGFGPEVTIGRAMSDDGVTFTLTMWVELNGQRVTNYNSMSAQLKDDLGNLIVNFGSSSSQTSDGLFSFTAPVAAIVRNVPYIIAAQATQGSTTTSYNLGFVRV
jgi:hypothetical protein